MEDFFPISLWTYQSHLQWQTSITSYPNMALKVSFLRECFYSRKTGHLITYCLHFTREEHVCGTTWPGRLISIRSLTDWKEQQPMEILEVLNLLSLEFCWSETDPESESVVVSCVGPANPTSCCQWADDNFLQCSRQTDVYGCIFQLMRVETNLATQLYVLCYKFCRQMKANFQSTLIMDWPFYENSPWIVLLLVCHVYQTPLHWRKQLARLSGFL